MGSDTSLKVWEGGARKNLTPTTKDFEKSSIVLQKVGGAWPPSPPSSEALIYYVSFFQPNAVLVACANEKTKNDLVNAIG